MKLRFKWSWLALAAACILCAVLVTTAANGATSLYINGMKASYLTIRSIDRPADSGSPLPVPSAAEDSGSAGPSDPLPQ